MEGPKTAKTFQLNSPVEKDEVLLPEYDEGRVPELDDLGQGEHPGPECHHLWVVFVEDQSGRTIHNFLR